VLAARCEGKEITTVEGLRPGGELDELQRLFLKHGALQCGYCTPGMLMAVKALLKRNLRPTLEEVKVGLGGNLCRCTGYTSIFEAVMSSVIGIITLNSRGDFDLDQLSRIGIAVNESTLRLRKVGFHRFLKDRSQFVQALAPVQVKRNLGYPFP